MYNQKSNKTRTTSQIYAYIFCICIDFWNILNDYFQANEFRFSWMIIFDMLWITTCGSMIALNKSSRCILLFHQTIPIILFHSNIHKMVNSSSTVLNIKSNPLVKIYISFPKQRLDCKMKKKPLRSMHCVCRHAFVLAGMVKYVLIILFKI